MVKRDAIHGQVVDVFRRIGLSVYDAAHAGNSFPDLVVGSGGVTYLVELKTGKAPLSAGQVAFAASWKGSPVVVLRSVTEAVDWAVGIRRHHERRRADQDAA
jgi:Holliday junction resolvase